MRTAHKSPAEAADVNIDVRHTETLLSALGEHSDTACIPILMVTDEQITAGDRAKLSDSVTTITEKAELDRDRFTAEVRRAMSGRHSVA